MDDILEGYIGPTEPPWLRALARPTLYGRDCVIEPAKPNQFAGLRVMSLGDEVWTAALTPNETELALHNRLRLRRYMGGKSFCAAQKRIGLISGQLLYTIDRTTGPRWHLDAQIAFCLRELQLHDYTDSDLRQAMFRVQDRAPGLDLTFVWNNRDHLLTLGRLWRRASLLLDDHARAQAARQ